MVDHDLDRGRLTSPNFFFQLNDRPTQPIYVNLDHDDLRPSRPHHPALLELGVYQVIDYKLSTRRWISGKLPTSMEIQPSTT